MIEEKTEVPNHKAIATELRRKQHTRSSRERAITDNMIQILDPKGPVNEAMRPMLLRKQIRALNRL